MHKSKGFRKFLSRIECFQEDIEVVDVFFKNIDSIADVNVIFKGVTQSHPFLYRRQNSKHNRILVTTHLKHTLYVSVIKEMYEEVMLYFNYALKSGALTIDNPERLVGDDQKINMTANDILVLQSKEEIVALIMGGIFRKLENKRNTLLLINELNSRLGLNVTEEVITKAMPYLDARHTFVHADGLADEEFKAKYPAIELNEDGKIKLNSKIMKSAFSAIKSLISEFDKKMCEKKYFAEVELT